MRVQIPFAVETEAEVSTTKVVVPVVGATVTVANRETSESVSVFAAETGGSVISSPITDAHGNIPGWLTAGPYTLTISGGTPSIAPINTAWDAVSGRAGSIGTPLLAESAVSLTKLEAAIRNQLHKTGDLRITALPSIEEGWVACEGQAESRIGITKALFEKIGTTYGAGNGTTTFNVPDFRGRSIIGAGTGSGLTARNRGEKIGEESHKLTVTELAAHQHPLTSSTNKTMVQFETVSGEFANVQEHIGAGGFGWWDGGAAKTGAEGGNEPHNNMQPSAVCNIWIKL